MTVKQPIRRLVILCWVTSDYQEIPETSSSSRLGYKTVELPSDVLRENFDPADDEGNLEPERDQDEPKTLGEMWTKMRRIVGRQVQIMPVLISTVDQRATP